MSGAGVAAGPVAQELRAASIKMKKTRTGGENLKALFIALPLRRLEKWPFSFVLRLNSQASELIFFFFLGGVLMAFRIGPD